MKRFITITACTVFAVTMAAADTVHLKNGITVDGTVVKINDNCMAVKSGNGQIIYQNDEIDRVEENDKKGALDLAKVNPLALRIEQEMEKSTGLTAAQRERVISIIDRFAREDSNERNQAIKELIALQQQFDVYRFLRESRQSYGARVFPGVLEVMLAINKAETKPIIYENLEDKTPVNRAAALELLGKHRELASVEMVGRGILDADPEVQLAAIHALAEIGDARATPALIETLSNTNPRIRNAGNTALRRIWDTPQTPAKFETEDEWKKLWSEASARVSKPIELASLQPLYVLQEGEYVLTHE